MAEKISKFIVCHISLLGHYWWECPFTWTKNVKIQLSHIMTKPAFAICEQQRRRSACASGQSDQHLCCSLPGWYNTYTCYSQNFKTLVSLCSWAGRFESYLVANPEDRFTRDKAQFNITLYMKALHGRCATDFNWKRIMSRLMTKATKWQCAQWRLRSAWASAQSDQNLRCALSG